jgi:hypothetical protein
MTSLLKWSTSSEQGTKDFEVQYNTNTLSWITLGNVATAGTSTFTPQYKFTQYTPKKRGANYYRILQKDFDYHYTYSKIVSLTFLEKGAGMHVYPNPAAETFTVFLTESQKVRLINAVGATVCSGTLPAGHYQVSLTYVSKGMYWIVAGNT